MFTLACGEKEEEDTGILEDTSSETDTEDTSDTDTEETGDTDTDTEDTGTEASCEQLSVEECQTRDDCHTRSGNPMSFDEPNQCWNIEAAQETHCMSNDMGCGDAITYAHAPDSEDCWHFTDTCIPEGWTMCDYPDEPECN